MPNGIERVAAVHNNSDDMQPDQDRRLGRRRYVVLMGSDTSFDFDDSVYDSSD